MRRLHELGKLSGEDIELFGRLRNIRNEVVHFASDGFLRSPTAAEAVEYDELVQTMIRRLEAIKQEGGYVDLKEGPAIH
jgi:hypothetical protein